jgi:hypothetical protein
MTPLDIAHSKTGLRWRHWILRYTAALVATGIALSIWFLWPMMRQDPFAIFIAAVIVSARFLGFGPALLCTAASGLAIDYFTFEPRFSFSLSANDYGRLPGDLPSRFLAWGTAQLPMLARAMRPGAEWRIASDDPVYQAWITEVMQGQSLFDAPPPVALRPPCWPPTRYEAKALREGRMPHYWTFIRR